MSDMLISYPHCDPLRFLTSIIKLDSQEGALNRCSPAGFMDWASINV